MLQFMRSQRVGHNLATEQQQSKEAHSLGFLKKSIVSFLKVTIDSSTLVKSRNADSYGSIQRRLSPKFCNKSSVPPSL